MSENKGLQQFVNGLMAHDPSGAAVKTLMAAAGAMQQEIAEKGTLSGRMVQLTDKGVDICKLPAFDMILQTQFMDWIKRTESDYIATFLIAEAVLTPFVGVPGLAAALGQIVGPDNMPGDRYATITMCLGKGVRKVYLAGAKWERGQHTLGEWFDLGEEVERRRDAASNSEEKEGPTVQVEGAKCPACGQDFAKATVEDEGSIKDGKLQAGTVAVCHHCGALLTPSEDGTQLIHMSPAAINKIPAEQRRRILRRQAEVLAAQEAAEKADDDQEILPPTTNRIQFN